MKKTTYRNLIVTISLSLALGIGFSAIKNDLKKVNAEEIGDYGDATRMPSMTFYGDPSSQIGFCWTTTNYTGTNLEVVEKSLFDNSNGWDDDNLPIKYFEGTIEPSLIAGDGFIHRANASRLKADTAYVYRFGDEELNVWCEQGSFKTSAKTTRNFSFLHISDPQGDNALHYASYHQLLNDMNDNFNPEWIALTGDITDDSHFGGSVDLKEWEMALTDQWDVFKDYPVAAVSGNHDGALHAFNSRYNYDYPKGCDTSTGSYYSFSYQGVHFTCINSNDTSNPKDPDTTGLSEEQLSWVSEDLAAHKDDKFLIVMMHKGLFDAGGHSCNADRSDYDIEKMRRQLSPMFTKYGVDLVLEGHDHLFNLSYPMVADEYVGQQEYYRIDEHYKYSYRDFGEHKNVYTFSNLRGTFYFNTGTASGQKYYAPVIGGSMEDTIFDASNPNQKMFTMVDILDKAILLRTYLCTSNEIIPYKTYAIANDEEGTPIKPESEHNTDFEIKGDYSFQYHFSRYNHVADINMKMQKLVSAEADLAGKFVGNFEIEETNCVATLRLYRTGKAIMTCDLPLSGEEIKFVTDGEWYMDEVGEIVLKIKDEKESLITYIIKSGSAEPTPEKKGGGCSASIGGSNSIIFILGFAALYFAIRKLIKSKKKA